MPDCSDAEVARRAATVERGSIVAAAGYGKTEQIARAVACSDHRRLVLTHTHAGVDAIKRRLHDHQVPPDKYRVDTIAGWCLRFVSAFPKRSGIAVSTLDSTTDWNAIYQATVQLLKSGAASGVISASYGGLFVDEYQDCMREQHAVISLLAQQMLCCVFGDPLQAIFDFRGQEPVDWEADVFPTFPKECELQTPWRWKKAKNDELGEWLKDVRRSLERGETLDLTVGPRCLHWAELPTDTRFQQIAVIRECHAAIPSTDDGNLIVIGDGANVNSRAALAQRLAQKGFSNIEPLNCKELYRAAQEIQESTGRERFTAVLDFASRCMTGTERSDLERAAEARLAGRRRGQAQFGDVLSIITAMIETNSDEAVLRFLRRMQERPGTHLFRREMFFAMCSALQIKIRRQLGSLSSAIWEVQNRVSHVGRKLARRSIGSTLLVKGLEFDNSVILHSSNLSRKDWYVALTRATSALRVVSPTSRLLPPSQTQRTGPPRRQTVLSGIG